MPFGEGADRAREVDRPAGEVSIERRVVTQMRGYDYLGNPIYFERSNTYRMTFMRDGQVIRVEVDARSGRIRNRSDR